jgi:CBS domain-containing protein
MTCADIMTPDPLTVLESEPLENAVTILRDNRFRSIPVVDEDGKMVGQFGIHALLKLLVPKIATMRLGIPRLPFVTDDIDDLRRRLSDRYHKPIKNFVEAEYIIVHPDTPLTRVVLGLYHCHDNLPVVDEKTGRLIGIVSYWDIVGRLLD